MTGMKANRTWQGVRMRRVMAAADPDAPPRLVTLPAAWDDTAAAALAELVAGDGPVALATAADEWVRPVAERALRAGLEMPLAERLHQLLLLRRGAPTASVWRGDAASVPGFVLNLAAFHDTTSDFDVVAFAQAVETAVIALTLAAPNAPRIVGRHGRSVGTARASRHRLRFGRVAGVGWRARGHSARPCTGGVWCACATVRRGRNSGVGLAGRLAM